MSRHFRLNSVLSGAIAKRLLHAKIQLSAPVSFSNQFVTDIYIYCIVYMYIYIFFLIDKFGDFSRDIDFDTKINIFRDVISLIINQCDPRRPKGASGGHKVSASRAAQASEARLYIYKYTLIEF